MENATANLTGSVMLLPNMATDYVIRYSWTDPDGETIRTNFSGDFMVMGETLVVSNLENYVGNFNLTACLTIPDTTVLNHCTTAEYFITNDG